MGCCSSKPNTTSNTQNPRLQDERRFQNKVAAKLSGEIANKEVKQPSEEKLGLKKKELFVIQHRRSNDTRSDTKASSSESDGSMQPAKTESSGITANLRARRTSSCTKEEVDAILIQCGRLSRSSSGSARKYSGSKRSHDFDRENEVSTELNCENNGDIDDNERETRRHSRGSSRRRTPSRSLERDTQSQRSGSRERAGGGSRRVSRSPGRRSKSPVTKSGNLGNCASSSSNGAARPGKMISVPATVSIDKNNNDGDCNVRRVLVKRNVGEGLTGSRGGTPHRSRSPASRSNGVDSSGGKEASLSRSSSRKAEHSPFRRTPLNEIDMGSLPFQPLANRASSSKAPYKCNEIEEVVVKQQQPMNLVPQDKLGIDVNYAKVAAQGCNGRGSEVKEIAQMNYCIVKEKQQNMSHEDKREQMKANGPNTTNFPLTLNRSRSSRRSRDLDINVEALMNTTPATNYNLLLLQDIQNFHQKTSASTSSSDNNPNANTSSIGKSLPECLSKVSSIVDAVADLNSSTKPNNLFTNARNSTGNSSHVSSSVDGKTRLENSNIPFAEEDDDNVSEPSIHQYVTVRKRGSGFESFQRGDFEELESSGSNSYTSGSRQHCVSSSSWEPNSADSTDRWTSRSREGATPVTLDRPAFSSNRAREL